MVGFLQRTVAIYEVTEGRTLRERLGIRSPKFKSSSLVPGLAFFSALLQGSDEILDVKKLSNPSQAVHTGIFARKCAASAQTQVPRGTPGEKHWIPLCQPLKKGGSADRQHCAGVSAPSTFFPVQDWPSWSHLPWLAGPGKPARPWCHPIPVPTSIFLPFHHKGTLRVAPRRKEPVVLIPPLPRHCSCFKGCPVSLEIALPALPAGEVYASDLPTWEAWVSGRSKEAARPALQAEKQS